VDGQVGLHVLEVALGHPRERLLAVGSAPGEGRDRVDLPGRPGLAGSAALLDDAKQPVGALLVNVPAAQALARQRQQVVDHESGGRRLADLRPGEPGVQAVTRRFP
jgi:hypothetical protein